MSQNTIYIDGRGDIEIKEALEILTDEFIDNGFHSDQTMIDLREALKERLNSQFVESSIPHIYGDSTPCYLPNKNLKQGEKNN